MFDRNHAVIRRFSSLQVHNLFGFAVKRLNEERLPQVAASLTFTTMLAMVPLLTIALAIFTSFPLFNTFQKSLEAYFIQNLMPRSMANVILENLNQFAAKATRLSAIGAVFLTLTAVSMIALVDKTFNQIWHVRTQRALPQRIVIYWATITLGPFLIGVSITATSYLFTATRSVVGELPLAGTMFFTLASMALTTAAFGLLYMIVPNKKVLWQDALFGGALAAIAFEITKRVFASFVSHFPNYTMVYGALAAVPVFLVWVYLGWLIVLSGAVVAAAVPAVRNRRWQRTSSDRNEFFDAMTILEVLYRVRMNGRSNMLALAGIAAEARLDMEECEALLQTMRERGWVARIKSEHEPGRLRRTRREAMDCWTLLSNPERLFVADVYRTFALPRSAEGRLFRLVDAAIEAGLRQSLGIFFSKDTNDFQ